MKNFQYILNKYRNIILLVVIIILFISLRLLFLNADPFGIGWSTGSWTDPGFYLHNTRHKVLFNDWTYGNWDSRYLFPIYTLYYYIFLNTFGINNISVILSTILSQIITLIFLYKIFKLIYKKEEISLIGIFIFSYFFYFVRNSRIPLLENIMLMFWTISIYYLFNEKKNSIIKSVIFYILSMSSKLNIVYCLPALIIKIYQEKKIKTLLVSIIIVSIFFSIAGYIIFILEPPIVYYTITNKPFPGLTLRSIFYNVYNTTLFMRAPFISIFAYIYFAMIVLLKPKLNRYQLFLITSFITTHLAITISSYLPERYYSIILFIIYLLFIDFINFIMKYSIIKIKPNISKAIIITGILHLMSYNIIWVYNRSILKRRIAFELVQKQSIIITIILIITVIGLLYILKQNYRKQFVVLLLLSSFTFNIYHYIFKINERSYSLYNIRKYIKNNLEENKIITGWWAPALAIHSNMKTLTVYDGNDYLLFDYDYLLLEGEMNLTEKYGKQLNQIESFYIEPLRKIIVLYEVLTE